MNRTMELVFILTSQIAYRIFDRLPVKWLPLVPGTAAFASAAAVKLAVPDR